MKTKNSIDKSHCKNCGICTEICPNKIIRQNGSVHFKQEREHLCLQCGQCMAVCPAKAIHVKGLTYENDFTEFTSDKLDYNGFMKTLGSRRSVRTFKNQPVSNELIDEIVNSISYAPYGAAPEKMEINIINKREIIESALPLISKFFQRLEKMIENPIKSLVLRAIAGKENFHTIKNHLYPIAKGGNYNLDNWDGITRGAPSIITIHAAKNAEAHSNNGVIYATYIMLTAHAIGLGATMIECVPPAINRDKQLKELFQIPKENEAVMSIIIGHPKYQYKRGIKRKKHKIRKVT
jgi:ferredoxin